MLVTDLPAPRPGQQPLAPLTENAWIAALVPVHAIDRLQKPAVADDADRKLEPGREGASEVGLGVPPGLGA